MSVSPSGSSPRQGRFITFEGGEGTGKSTQVERLVTALERAGLTVVATREPGGTPGGEDIRALLVRGEVARWEPMSEAILNYAARFEHLEKKIRPALAAGSWVVSDRFADSTTAYQGYGHGLDLGQIADLHRAVVGDFAPDLTLMLDIPVEAGLKRATAGADGGEDRYERMDKAFHERLRQGFLDIAAKNPARCAVVDAAGTPEEVSTRIFEIVQARLGVSLL